MMHECIIEKRPDLFSVREQYLIRCRCHMEAFITWQPDDPEFVCPESAKLTDTTTCRHGVTVNAAIVEVDNKMHVTYAEACELCKDFRDGWEAGRAWTIKHGA